MPLADLDEHAHGFHIPGGTEINLIEHARQCRLKDKQPLIDLSNSNPTRAGYYFPTEILREEVVDYINRRDYNPDPKGLFETRVAISNYYHHRTPSLKIDPDNIFITSSSSESYALLFSLLCDPGDTVLAPNFGYPLIDMIALSHKINLDRYRVCNNSSWAIDYGSIQIDRTSKIRAVILISPHNPTGLIVSNREEKLAKIGLPIIADEVFSEFTYIKPTAPPLGALYPDIPVFHLNGISKMFALPDLKLGWIALNDVAAKKYGKNLEILNDSYLSASQLTQTIVPKLFSKGKDFAQRMYSDIFSNFTETLSTIQRSSIFSATPPDGGIYLPLQLTSNLDEEELVVQLIKNGIYLHPGYFYGENSSCQLIISMLSPSNQLSLGVEKLIKIISSLQPQG